MKKLILIVAICFANNICKAQLITTLVIVPQPPGSLINWGAKDLTYIINNQAGSAPARVLIKATLKASGGTIAASTNLARAKVFTVVPGGNIILYAADVIPMDLMTFHGKYKSALEKTGKLPADNYELCVQLVRPTDFTPMSEERCRNFTLAAFQLPIPMMPANGDVMDATSAQTAITFRWTPVTPRPADMIRYIVTVFEILDRQTPLQALRSNQPLLTKEITGTTQFIWQPQMSFAKTKVWADDVDSTLSPEERAVMDSTEATSFIWTIQTVDNYGLPFGDGNVNSDGVSEPNRFTIIHDRRIIKTGPPARIIFMNNRKGIKN